MTKEQSGHFPYRVETHGTDADDQPVFQVKGAWPESMVVWTTTNGDEAWALSQVMNEAYRMGEAAGEQAVGDTARAAPGHSGWLLMRLLADGRVTWSRHEDTPTLSLADLVERVLTPMAQACLEDDDPVF